MKKKWFYLTKFEIKISENIKENISKIGILKALSRLSIWAQNYTASIQSCPINADDRIKSNEAGINRI